MTEKLYSPTENVSKQALLEERIAGGRKWLRRCGIALLTITIFNLLTPIILMLVKDLFWLKVDLLAGADTNTIEFPTVPILISGAIFIGFNTIIAIGAYSMWQVQEGWFLRLAAITAMLPCTILFWPISFPFGLTALIILLREDPELLLHNPEQPEAA